MDEATAALVALSATLGTGDRSALASALDDAADAAEPLAVEEALLQSHLFLGYPAALNALALWRERSGRSAPPATTDDLDRWRERGERVCAAVYGGQYERLRENIARLHPDMERWMVCEGYGRVLGRPGLALETREVCIAALLAAQDAPRQLYAHLRGAIQVGAAPADVGAAVEIACDRIPPQRAEAARRVWSEVRDRTRRPQDTAVPPAR